ncbi:cytochrome d ubiquinol oxidase subunit II [Mycolicibacterium moriokaense]|nr:cytochrome d ubiquinol oxidase subunit II [Mycolicibacterium moriokaense]
MNETTTVGALEHRIISALRVVVPVVIVCFYLWRIFGGLAPVERFSDDFFYYAVPARNWVDGAGSTFFPGEPTNGYHPLWFLWVALLYRVAGGGVIFFGLADLTLMALLVGFFLVFERFLRRVTGDRLAAAVGAAVAAVSLTVVSRAGVEVALAAFATALLLDYLSRKPLADQTVRDAAIVGLLGAFLVLARLDAVFLAPGLVVAVISRWDWRRLSAVVVGAVPVYAYLVFNLVVYGHLGTSSMAAKSLDVYWPPNLWFLEFPSRVVMSGVVATVLVVSVVVGVMLRRSENADVRRIALALAVAPVLQLAAQALFSGWTLFPWYFYFFVMVLGVAAALVFMGLRRWNALRWAGIPLGAVMLLVAGLGLVAGEKPDPWQRDAAANAARLQAFSVDHPGVYAMGDAAGTPEWTIGLPIVHLEGLMMSPDFVDRIRERQPLEQVFRDYHVDYYVAVRPADNPTDGCLQFAEPTPQQASPRAPHLTTTICSAPVKVIQTGDRNRLQVYRVDPTTGKVV